MRICFIATAINTQTGGGSHRNIVSIIRTLREAGHEVTVHTIFSSRNAPPADIVIEKHQAEGLSFIALTRFIGELIKKHEQGTDLFFVYGHTLLWGAGKYRLRGKVPVLVYLDNYLSTMSESMIPRQSFSQLGHRAWERIIGQRYVEAIDRLFVVSAFLRDVYVRAGFPLEKCIVIPNFFEFIEIPPSERQQSRLLYAGRLSLEKGTDILLDALNMLPKEVEWEAHIAGDGPLRPIVEAAAKKDPRVRFRSWLSEEDLLEEYTSASIFVHPARWSEPFGRTIVEAMHAGVAVIIPEKGGSAEIVRDAGLTFNNGNVNDLFQKISVLLKDKILRGSLGKLGVEHARRFSKETIVPVLLKEIESVARASKKD